MLQYVVARLRKNILTFKVKSDQNPCEPNIICSEKDGQPLPCLTMSDETHDSEPLRAKSFCRTFGTTEALASIFLHSPLASRASAGIL